MKRVVLASLLLLGACGQPQAPDGYEFRGREWTRPETQLVIVEHKTQADLVKAAPKGTEQEGHKLMAWSRITPTRCEVHVVAPETSYEPEWLGHEVAHCSWGRRHP